MDEKKSNAGRKPLKDKKERVVLFIRGSAIKKNGGVEKLKKAITKSIEEK